MEKINGGVTAPLGFLASGMHCGLKRFKKDLALIYSKNICNTAAVYTTNYVKGEPLYVTAKHLEDKKSQAIIINSANANTCTGDKGKENAFKMTKYISDKMNIKQSDVLVASTGVIGVQLPVEKIEKAVPKLVSTMNKAGGEDASHAILTTDIRTKEIAVALEIGGQEVTIGAMAKGSGMVHPNMATMLSFITTDINIDDKLLDKALRETVDKSYHNISIDGDTSTNDMVVIMANANANNIKITSENEDYMEFIKALEYINIYLAKEVARDGEGATKLLECVVENAKTENDAKTLAKSVIKSTLVKTAMFGNDPNWGRILCALGYTKVYIDTSKLKIDLVDKTDSKSVTVYKDGGGVEFNKDKAKDVLDQNEVKIMVKLQAGDKRAVAWGCDLSYDYVKINGEYTT